MSKASTQIFISGSTADFEQIRCDLHDDLARGLCHPSHQKDFPAMACDTVLKLARLIQRCWLMVHLVGRQPGEIADEKAAAEYLDFADKDGEFLSKWPDLRAALGDFSGITYTQWEALIAIHLGMDLLVYADATNGEPDHPQRKHLDRLRLARRYPETYRDESHLFHVVLPDILAYFNQDTSPGGLAAALKPSNLPGGYIGRLFLGREEFLEEIRASLLKQTSGATAITQQQLAATGISGLGGIGKTHAAVEYAHRHRGRYSALLFASADTPKKLLSSLAALCRVLRLDDLASADEPSRVQGALDWLASHDGWLLICDNIDDETAAEAFIQLLDRLRNGHVLITSRLQGWADSVEALDLDVLKSGAAAELILKLTDKPKGRRRADDDDTQALILAEMLDGLPLAIQQAAGYICEQALTIAGYIALYRKEAIDLLQWFSSHKIPYERPEKLAPRPVLVTWKTSFDKLSSRDRFWLLVFSRFAPDPIPEFLLESVETASSEAQADCREARNAIVNAEKYSLLVRSRTEPTFKVHRLVQQITRVQASESEGNSSLTKAIKLIESAKPGNPLDVRSWLKWRPLQSHAISICDRAKDEQAPGLLSWLLGQLDNLLDTQGLPFEAEKYSRRALKIDRAAFGNDHPEVATRLNNLAQLLQATNRIAEAEPLMRDALRIDRAAFGNNHPNVARDLNNLAQLLKATNRPRRGPSPSCATPCALT